MDKLSIIVPVFNEEETIPIFYNTVLNVKNKYLNEVQIEFWFVDDGSTDDTILEINKLVNFNSNVHFVQFSRNFGKEAALYAGLENASGDYVAVMDVDLQDPPELLPQMLEGVRDGDWDVVGSRRKNRIGESKIRSWFSKVFYKIINKISATHIEEGARDYRVMSRKVVDAILSMSEYNRFSKGIFSWVGFKQKYISFDNTERVAGSTSWSFWNLVKYSIEGIVAFSQFPLKIVSVLGLLTFVGALVGAIVVIVRSIINPTVSAFGWPSMVVIMLGLGGIQLLSLGVVGRYVSSIYLEVKHRPIYIAKKIK